MLRITGISLLHSLNSLNFTVFIIVNECLNEVIFHFHKLQLELEVIFNETTSNEFDSKLRDKALKVKRSRNI